MKKEKKITIALSIVVVSLITIMIAYPFFIINNEKSKIENSVKEIISSANNYFLDNNKEMVFTIKDGNILEDGLNYDGYLPDSGIIKINKSGEIQIVVNNKLWCAVKSYEQRDIDVKTYNSNCEIQNSVKIANINVNIVDNGDGLYAANDGYYYRGLNPKNYFMLDDILFRIVGIDSQGNIKLITNDNLYTRKWNSNKSTNNSFEILNNNNVAYFLNTKSTDNKNFEKLKRENYILEYTWNLTKLDYKDRIIYNELKQHILINKTIEALITMPTIADYIGSTTNEGCILDSINNEECGNNNYLNIGESFFTMTSSNDSIWIVNKDGKVEEGSLNDKFGIRPMIVITGNIEINGKGTIENPYKIVTK